MWKPQKYVEFGFLHFPYVRSFALQDTSLSRLSHIRGRVKRAVLTT